MLSVNLERPRTGSVLTGYATVRLKKLYIYETQSKDWGEEEGSTTFNVNDHACYIIMLSIHEGAEWNGSCFIKETPL